VAIVVLDPGIEALIEVLKMVSESPERFEVDTTQINAPGQQSRAIRPGFWIEQLVNVRHVDDEVMQIEKYPRDIANVTSGLKLSEALLREVQLRHPFPNVDAPLIYAQVAG